MTETPKDTTNSSLLEEIIAQSQQKTDQIAQTPASPTTPPEQTGENPPPKKPSEPLSAGVILKLIGALLFTVVIALGSFLTYVVFNPAQAVFFVTIFRIDPAEVANILKQLINISFGVVVFILSIAWIISLFRAIWTPKELKRKKLLSSMLAIIVGIMLFGILAFWAFLFDKIQRTSFDNVSGRILIYDNNLLLGKDTQKDALLSRTQNLIGPITLRYDIRANATKLITEKLVKIESFEMKFDGGICNDGTSVVRGVNPTKEENIICTFNEIKNYTVKGEYTTTDRLGRTIIETMDLPDIEIRGMVNTKSQLNTKGEEIITLSADSIKAGGIGNPTWVYADGKEITTTSIAEVATQEPKYICLKLEQASPKCERIFIIQNTNKSENQGEIAAIVDSTNYRLYHFSLTGLTVNKNTITDIRWLHNGTELMCRKGEEVCDYPFTSPGKKKVTVEIDTAAGETLTLKKDVEVKQPIRVENHLKVSNIEGKLLNEEKTYDNGLRAFVLENLIIPPETITLDAREVISDNPGYTKTSVVWEISNGKRIEKLSGERVNFTINEPLRYEIKGIYTFEKLNPIEGDTPDIITDTVIINIERKSIIPRLKVNLSSDYIPAIVSVDASESESLEGEIKKFIFDFGEKKLPAEGDAFAEYEYTSAGEKTILLTIVDENGKTATLKKTIVLKDEARVINWTASINPAIAGSNIDFEASGTNGQIQEYVWNFGDNTSVTRGYLVTHTFAKPGTYNVTLTVVYSDGTRRSESKNYTVVASY